jgi:hypothetical protein
LTEPDNIPDRVTQLEVEMSEVRVLARGADEDVSNMQQTLNAHISTLNALRQTQLDQGQSLTTLRQTQLDQGQSLTTLRQTQLEQGKEMREGFRTVTSLLTEKASEE